MTLVEFLLARVAEDEEPARMAKDGWVSGDDMLPLGCWEENRVLAECEAKRRIVNEQGLRVFSDTSKVSIMGQRVLCALALPYADHPDYQQEWAI